MRKTKLKIKALFIALLLFFACGISIIALRPQTAYAYSSDYIKVYDITYDISSNRTMHVTEDITCAFYGHSGIQRYLPANAGDRVRNVEVKVYDKNDALTDIDYDVDVEAFDDSNLFDDKYCVVLTITDGVYKYNGDTQKFHIEYDYEITQPQNDNAIYLNAIGYGWECLIETANITLKLPKGYTSADLFIGKTKVTSNDLYNYDEATNTITATITDLTNNNGVSFDLYFKSGVLSTRFDIVPYIVVIAACVILGILIAVKFLAFNSSILTPVVNFTAPDDMDPLVMGKLIDNKVNTEDITSLIFYWADKGYLKINMQDENDPEFIRIVQRLPEGTPAHQNVMYNSLFERGDIVKVSQLENKFYPTVEAVTKDVNAKYKGLYNSKSIAISIIFALLGAALMILPPIILAKVTISSKLFYYKSIVMIVPAFIIYALTESLMYMRLKISRKKAILLFSGIILLAAIMTALYTLLMPGVIMETAPKILVCILGYAVIILSVWIISRTEDYTKKLNEIVGFRNFILYTEKDKLEAMLEEDPQFYYHILPYAQILNVTDIWEDKFKSITVVPPSWSAGPVETYIEISVISHAIRHSNARMVSKMTSRPSSSGSSGGGHGRFGGGSFGGFGGGGHGGGGGRFI